MNMTLDPGPHLMTPSLRIADPGTAWWVGQFTLRLRREIAWSRTKNPEIELAQEMLDLVRHDEVRAAFFVVDPACAYLTECMEQPRWDGLSQFQTLVEHFGLTDAECFVLAAAIAARVDGALGPVLAAVQSDAAKPWPTLALVQSLWDAPLDVLAAQDPARPLLADGLLSDPNLDLGDALIPAPGVARFLTGTSDPEAYGLKLVAKQRESHATADRFAHPPTRLEIVVTTGPAVCDAEKFVGGLLGASNRRCLTVSQPTALRQALLIAGLSGHDIVLPTPFAEREGLLSIVADLSRNSTARLRVFLHLTDRDLATALPQHLMGPVLPLPSTGTSERIRLFQQGLGAARPNAAIRRAAREFRLEPKEISRITSGLDASVSDKDLLAACRVECALDFQGLAEALEPRFSRDDLVLPRNTSRQLDEVISAVRGAGRVQHDWGGDDAFGDSGIALLFAGVPGTGKTMAAQVLAFELNLPVWRVDLSQIVNKYIGETEKNLKRIFDIAEKLRSILFFDEAEALFGKRTEVKDANDRFANIETGYLLQRIESFTGVAILATNRRKDLDEAFARRLRYLIEFPMPGAEERQQIWARVFPPGADISELDLVFLGRRFQLSGGHIRSVAINASLQTAAHGRNRVISMESVLIAAKRELEKLNRATGADTFGPWYQKIEELRT